MFSTNETGANLFLTWLRWRQINVLFFVPGAQIAPLLEVLAKAGDIQAICANHELGAAYMADGYARATKKCTLCLSIGGPGASNMLTAAITARLDHSRILFITGNVQANLQGIGAFQDGSAVACRDQELYRIAINQASSVFQVEDLLISLNKAWSIMQATISPAHISIAKNVWEDQACWSVPKTIELKPILKIEALLPITNALNEACKLLLVLGKTLYSQDSRQLINAFTKRYALPVVTTLGAKGLMQDSDAYFFGNIGFGGGAYANHLIMREQFDLLLVLGTDLGERDTLNWDENFFPPNRKLIRIDGFATPPNHPFQATVEVVANSLSALEIFQENPDALEGLALSTKTRRQWLKTLTQNIVPKRTLNHLEFDKQEITLESLLLVLQTFLPEDTVLVADAGLHRQAAAEHWQIKQSHSFYNPASTAAMGWGIAAAIGVKLSNRDRPVIALTGDGCSRMHGFEMATAARYQIPVLFVICNNMAYASTASSMSDVSSKFLKLPNIDWLSFAHAIGIRASQVSNLTELENNLTSLDFTNAPFLLEVLTPSLTAK